MSRGPTEAEVRKAFEDLDAVREKLGVIATFAAGLLRTNDAKEIRAIATRLSQVVVGKGTARLGARMIALEDVEVGARLMMKAIASGVDVHKSARALATLLRRSKAAAQKVGR